MTNGYERRQKVYMTFPFSSASDITFQICESWSANYAFVNKSNDVTNLLPCDITPIFSVPEPIPNLKYHSLLPLPSPYFHIENRSP